MPKAISLPDGLTVWAANRFEAAVLHREMFVERPYFRHGITLPADATVVDVGANIGMFGIYLSRHFPGATVHMLEPVPTTFSLLERNRGAIGPGFRAHLHNVGLGSSARTVTFQVDPELTFAASMSPDAVKGSVRDPEDGTAWAEAVLLDLPRIFPESRIARGAAAALRSRATRAPALALTRLLLKLDARVKAARLRPVECRVVRLSDFLREHAIEGVDLLKVDVEGAEVEVLVGLDDADWPRVHQLVVEVHDVDGRAERMAAMLRDLGYETVVEPEEWAVHRLLGITTLFARRASTSPAGSTSSATEDASPAHEPAA